MKDYYYILGIDKNATSDEIKKAYRKLGVKFHPDKNDGDNFFEERFKEINEAYETLIDFNKRKVYDDSRFFTKSESYYRTNNSSDNIRKPTNESSIPKQEYTKPKNDTEQFEINDTLKRIEPTSEICTFCGKHKAKNRDYYFYKRVYKINNRSNIIIHRTVNYSSIEIGVTRCNNCYSIHKSVSKKSLFYIILSFPLFFFICLCIYQSGWMFIPALILTSLLNTFIENKMLSSKNIISEDDGFNKSTLVTEFLNNGWSIKEPSA